MEHIKAFTQEARAQMPAGQAIPDALRAALDRDQVYAQSLECADDTLVFLARQEGNKRLFVEGAGGVFDRFNGEAVESGLKVCEQNADNAALLRDLFPFTKPRSLGDEPTTFGTGDRLGIATPGHVMAVEQFDALPVLAQQSVRELSLCGGRTYQDIVDCATWGVFERHFTRGYGADGDHLKSEEEIAGTISQGACMLTLDASEHIDNDAMGLTPGQIQEKYLQVPSKVRKPFEKRYLERFWEVRDKRGKKHRIEFDAETLAKAVLIYHKMIDFAVRVYENHVKGNGIDFEVSVDETLTPTDPAAHFLVANELIEAGVAIWSLAPRFCGEFQKGIDYIGDIAQFEQEFSVHAAIADFFGYKLSIHSGSDKFSVFPIIGKYTEGRLHQKTAGTSWLEAMRLIAMGDPGLFREMYRTALDRFDETRPYYHVNAEPADCPGPEGMNDEDLPSLLDQDDPRQIIHTTYGILLTSKTQNGAWLFRDRFYDALDRFEARHYKLLMGHIGRHLIDLGIDRI